MVNVFVDVLFAVKVNFCKFPLLSLKTTLPEEGRGDELAKTTLVVPLLELLAVAT